MNNQKLLDTGEYAPFAGTTVLFDQRGHLLMPNEARLLKTSAADPPITFYQALESAVQPLVRQLSSSGFVRLPPDTYHVTAADLAGVYSLETMSPSLRDQFERWLKGLPDSSPASLPPVPVFRPSNGPIRFRIRDLKVFGGAMALVARLEPADDESQRAVEDLIAYREQLDRDWAQYKSKAGSYTAHVSIGYWSSSEAVEAARQTVAVAAAQVALDMNVEMIEFNSASLYGFTDMVSFFKLG